MSQIKTYQALENLGREKFSSNYYARDFLYTEIGNFYGKQNIPINKDLFIQNGKSLCQNILEPITKIFGKISIRSAYRSPHINEIGNQKNHNCGSNQSNNAGHIWDTKDDQGFCGATICIFLPWFNDNFTKDEDWVELAFFLYDNINCTNLTFFAKQNCFNISWHENKQEPRSIFSYKNPKGYLIKPNTNSEEKHNQFYQNLQALLNKNVT